MKKNLKKGFTIVELVVVIAVIAILAAVLIPTYKDLVNSAHESKDTQLVRNLNTALTSGEKHETMADALAAAASYGYNVEKINASATDKEILWDSVNDLFCYYDTEDATVSYVPKFEPTAEVKDYQYWTISDAVSEKFSTYYTGTESEVNTTKGFDAGTSSVSVVNYTNSGEAQNVVIRTNGGNLTVNAPLDTIEHYGTANVVDVVEVASESYHLFGKVAFFKMQTGHAVIETGAYVEVVYKTTAESTITAQENAVINNAVASSAANVANGDNDLVFTVAKTTEEELKTEAKADLELHIKIEEGNVAKSASNKYYKTIAEALKSTSRVYVIVDTAENVTLPEGKVLIIEDGVNYTGTVSGLKVEITSDKKAYAPSFETAMSHYTKFSPSTNKVTVKLLSDITLKKQVMVNKTGTELTLDLNGYTVTSQYSLMTFLVKDNFNVTSTKSGAKIELGKAGFIQVSSDNKNSVVNVSNVVINRTEASTNNLVLNYGTFNITGSTVNSTVDINSSSSVLFNTYGNLTLGRNTVINVTAKLGTSFISANGSANVTVENATINVKQFRVNGGGFFSLANACKLVLRNANISIGLDETYGSYLVNNNITAKTVTIVNLTTNIVGMTSGSTYTVDAATATWAKN